MAETEIKNTLTRLENTVKSNKEDLEISVYIVSGVLGGIIAILTITVICMLIFAKRLADKVEDSGRQKTTHKTDMNEQSRRLSVSTRADDTSFHNLNVTNNENNHFTADDELEKRGYFAYTGLPAVGTRQTAPTGAEGYSSGFQYNDQRYTSESNGGYNPMKSNNNPLSSGGGY